MNEEQVRTPADLVFPPQVPFSWTRRWASVHRNNRIAVRRRVYRIAGSAASAAELAAAVAFCETHAATLTLD